MSYKIETVQYHTESIESNRKEALRRYEQQLDVSDCALSSWAESSMTSFHHSAIEALKMGEENGIDGPAGYFTVLLDEAGNEIGKLCTVYDQYKYCDVLKWRLTDKAAEKYGRRWLPYGEKSRIQKQLNIRQESKILPASRYMECSCSFVGGPVMHHLKRRDSVE